jgi:uncharacterized protein
MPMKKKLLFCVFILSVLPLASCRYKTAVISINDSSLKVEIADTPETRHRGLMFRKSMPADRGMLFIMPETQKVGFWMKNTTIPLSAAFISPGLVITEIIDMYPLDETLRPSREEVKYIIETNQGWFREKKIKEGDRVQGEIFPK